jgi:hypothetical protein
MVKEIDAKMEVKGSHISAGVCPVWKKKHVSTTQTVNTTPHIVWEKEPLWYWVP